MIASVQGLIINTSKKSITVSINGLGFEVFVTETYLSHLSIGDEVALYTHMVVRENSIKLFGFKEFKECALFKLLIDISGIGPRSALSIMDIGPIEKLQVSIANNDLAYLTSVSGIGKKIAEKILIELRDKMPNIQSGKCAHHDIEALEALISLGFPIHLCREALHQTDKSAETVEEKIKEALRVLHK